MTTYLILCSGGENSDMTLRLDFDAATLRAWLDEMDEVGAMTLGGKPVGSVAMEDRSFDVYPDMWLWSDKSTSPAEKERLEEFYAEWENQFFMRDPVPWPEDREFPNVDPVYLLHPQRLVSYQHTTWAFALENLDHRFEESLSRAWIEARLRELAVS